MTRIERRGRPRGSLAAAPRPWSKVARIVALHLKGEPNDVIADRLSIKPPQVRCALQRWLPRLERAA